MDAKRPIGLTVLTGLNAALVAAVLVVLIVGGGRGPAPVANPEKEREVAVALAGSGLYRQAAQAYEDYLKDARLDPEQRANVLYTVGNLYMEKLSDFGEALARFERIKTLYPQAKVIADVNRKVVECLERLGQTLDAQNALDQATRAGGAEKAAAGETVLARVGDREITDRDLADAIASLPPQVRGQFGEKDAKKEILRSLVQRELMFGAAVRRGLDKDPAVLAEAEKARRDILAGRVLKEEVYDKIDMSKLQVADYFQQHPDEFKGKDGKPLAQDQAMRLAQQKVFEQEQRRLSGKLFESLMAAQKAEIHEDRVQ